MLLQPYLTFLLIVCCKVKQNVCNSEVYKEKLYNDVEKKTLKKLPHSTLFLYVEKILRLCAAYGLARATFGNVSSR